MKRRIFELSKLRWAGRVTVGTRTSFKFVVGILCGNKGTVIVKNCSIIPIRMTSIGVKELIVI